MVHDNEHEEIQIIDINLGALYDNYTNIHLLCGSNAPESLSNKIDFGVGFSCRRGIERRGLTDYSRLHS